jgi:BASS family bile acid:Na+ symporter
MADLLHHGVKWSALLFLVCSMLAVGMNLTPQAIIAPLRSLRLVALALALNFVVAPAFAWLLTVIIPLDPGHAAGMLLLSGAAGAPFLPRLVQSARGDPAIAIALMALLTAGTLIFMPLALPWMIRGFAADTWAIARPLVMFIVLPLICGMLAKNRATTLATRAAPVFALIGNASLLLLFVLLIADNFRALLGVIGSGAILAATVYVIGLFGVSWALGGRAPDERCALALGTTARNFAAALVPATSSFSDPKVAIMLIVSAIIGLVVSFTAAAWVRRRMPVPPGHVGLKADGESKVTEQG